MAKSVFFTSFFEKRRTVETLIEESRADSDYFFFLTFAAFITTFGIIVDNPVVIVGAMLIAPILFPILALGMGVVTSNKDSINRSLKNIGKSLLLAVGVSAFTAFLLNKNEVGEQLMLLSQPTFISFMIAFFSGTVAAYAWAKQNTSSTLPGVAISVALLPPLSGIGVAMTMFQRDIFSGAILIFIINLLGIMLASVVVFSLFGFSSLARFEEKKIREEMEDIEAGKDKSVASL